MVKTEMIQYMSSRTWCGVLGFRMGSKTPLWEILPFGAIVATCDLVDCRPTGSFTNQELDEQRTAPEEFTMYVWTERMLGNYELGHFGWVLENVRPLQEPIPWRGRQGFFEVLNPDPNSQAAG